MLYTRPTHTDTCSHRAGWVTVLVLVLVLVVWWWCCCFCAGVGGWVLFVGEGVAGGSIFGKHQKQKQRPLLSIRWPPLLALALSLSHMPSLSPSLSHRRMQEVFGIRALCGFQDRPRSRRQRKPGTTEHEHEQTNIRVHERAQLQKVAPTLNIYQKKNLISQVQESKSNSIVPPSYGAKKLTAS